MYKNIKERQLKRKEELTKKLNEINLKEMICENVCQNYIRYGGLPNIDDICIIIQEKNFFNKFTKYQKFREEYYQKNIDFIKQKALIDYIKENNFNIHIILKEIPWSLKNKIDELYLNKENLLFN